MSYSPLVRTFAERRNHFCRAYAINRLLHTYYRSDLPFGGDSFASGEDPALESLYISERDSPSTAGEPALPYALEDASIDCSGTKLWVAGRSVS